MTGRAGSANVVRRCVNFTRTAVVAAVAVVSSMACAPDAPPPTNRPDGAWRAAGLLPARKPGDLSSPEPAVLQLAQSTRLGLDVSDDDVGPRERVIVNLEASGVLNCRGRRYSLVRDRAVALDGVRSLIDGNRKLADSPAGRSLLLRLDRFASSDVVLSLWSALPTARSHVTHVSFALAPYDEGAPAEARLDATTVARETPFLRPLAITLRIDGVDGAAPGVPHIAISARDVAFPPGDPFASEASLARANEAWTSVRSALHDAKQSGADGVRLRVDGRSPWAYLAMTLGLLLESGLEDVEVDGVPSAVHLSTPHDPAPDPYARVAGELPPWMAIGIGAALALAVHLLGRLGSTRRAVR